MSPSTAKMTGKVAKVIVPPASLIAAILLAIFGPKIDGVNTSTAATYISIALGVLLTGHHGQKLARAAVRKATRYAIRQATKTAVRQQQATAPPAQRQVAMYDSVDVGQIPKNATVVAGYVDGAWPTFQQLVRLFPHAKRLSIAVSARANAVCLDIEAGDATPGEAASWVHRQLARGVVKPVLYCSASVIPAVLAAIEEGHITRQQVRIWSAHYDVKGRPNVPHICHPTVCGYEAADATQWTHTSGGKNLDQTLCAHGFI